MRLWTMEKGVQVWNASSEESNPDPSCRHSDTIRCLVITPDGQHVTTGSEDGSVRFWGIASGSSTLCFEPVEPAAGATCLALLPGKGVSCGLAAGYATGQVRWA